MPAACAIDFGTSNSAIALPNDNEVALVVLESGHVTMPTAVFYAVEGLAPNEDPQRLHGRAALSAYLDGVEGRLMRSMKSILGSPLATQTTDIGGGRGVAYLDVIISFLRHLKLKAEQHAGHPLHHVVLGRPVFFVDDDPARDAAAQATLMQAALAVGFDEVTFQFEPIAAALDHEVSVDREQVVLVVDIGGGTSDFSLVRVGPERRLRMDRRDDILGNHGIHVAGTDFDRQIDLAHILPTCGFRSRGPGGREVPSGIYFDLATWHLINTVYTPGRIAEFKRMKSFFESPVHHERLMTVLTQQLGHGLMGQAEAAKIAVSQGGHTVLDLSSLEARLSVSVSQAQAIAAIDTDLERITHAARDTLTQANLGADQVDLLYLTGGSTGLQALVDRLAAQFPAAQVKRGDPFASVARGLGVHARRFFGDQ